MANQQNQKIVFYDGICGLCNRSVQFLIAHDVKQHIRYAPLQSVIAKKVLGMQVSMDSFVWFDSGKVYTRSDAAIRALMALGGIWKLAIVFWIIPRLLRDLVYNVIARKRYAWFGKYDVCKIPDAAQRHLFLE